MRIRFKKRNPIFSVVVNFYNNRREAARTLYSMTSLYQNVTQDLYEVIAIDNNSTEQLSEDFVKSFGTNFKYIYFKNDLPSPCKAINHGVSIAKSKYVVICIDGARILSPGIFNKMLSVLRFQKNPFVYTIGMHIGNKPQNYSISEGYNQEFEDKLMNTITWKENGYQLFDISSYSLSNKKGGLEPASESNCFMLKKSLFAKIGGYDIRFKSKGGGLCNLHFFNQINNLDNVFKCRLLGEATFHQFHCGVATNVSMDKHPWLLMKEEFFNIFGYAFKLNYSSPFFFK